MATQRKAITKGLALPPITHTSIDDVKAGEIVTLNVQANVERYLTDKAFGIYEVLVKETRQRKLAVKGTFSTGFEIGRYYRVTGKASFYQNQLQVDMTAYQSSYPLDEMEIMIALRRKCGYEENPEILFKALGQDIFCAIIERYQESVEKLKPLGVAEESVKQIYDAMTREHALEFAYQELLEFGLSESVATQILKVHGLDEVKKIQSNPYHLLQLELDISFKEVDELALGHGYLVDDKNRLREVIFPLMGTLTREEGHTLCLKSLFWEKYPLYAGKPMGAVEARQLIQKTKGSTITRKIGLNKSTISIPELKQAYEDWKALDKRERSSFAFPQFPVAQEKLEQAVTELIKSDTLKEVEKDGEIYFQLGWYHHYEKTIAKSIRALHQAQGHYYEEVQVKKALTKVLQVKSKELGFPIVLEPEQEWAVLTICGRDNGVYILTGPAGSGKTFIIQIIIATLELLHGKKEGAVSPRTLAPTGQAAQVAAKATKMEASTVHKYLGIVGNEVTKSASHDLLTNLYLVDESSMIDTKLMSQMASNIRHDVKVVFLGDTEQLPSVEAGSCLRDLIRSGLIPHCKLLTAKRQASGSGVLINANRIIRGESIATEKQNPKGIDGNAYHYQYSGTEEIVGKILELAKKFGLKGFQEGTFQILCAMKNSPVGTGYLNYVIQQAFNPYTEDSRYSEGKGYDRVLTSQMVKLPNGQEEPLAIHIGDKVINTQNNYEAKRYYKNDLGDKIIFPSEGIMNGETGVVSCISRVWVENSYVHRVEIRQGEEYINIDGQDIKDLLLAYAITIHKSQGSQWPVVASPFSSISPRMHTKQLLYTMYTRAQNTCVTVGDMRCLDFCIQNPDIDRRRTGLQEALREAF